MNDFDKDVINFGETIKGRYNSNNPKITFMVKTDIFNNIVVNKFGIIKLENNKIFGWLWPTDNTKEYISFDINEINAYNDDTRITIFKNKKSADEYALWLIMNGSKVKNNG